MIRASALLIAVLAAVSGQNLLKAQDAPTVKLTPRDTLRLNAGELTYPGGMLFHTAFQESYTTRFLLLKAALQSNKLDKFFALDERQRVRVRNLQRVTLDDAHREKLLDENAQPDEQLIDPDYFAFLDEDQLRQLDGLALRFDGYLALTRKSLADGLELTAPTREKIAKAALELRESLVLPRFRWEFTAKLPKDIGYRDCLFAARVGTRLNLTIVDVLTDHECERLRDLLTNIPSEEVLRAVEDLAVLPDGVMSLIKDSRQGSPNRGATR